LDQAKKDLGSLPPSEQGQIRNQLNQAEANEHQAELQLNQDGAQGEN
jgi:phage-related protein